MESKLVEQTVEKLDGVDIVSLLPGVVRLEVNDRTGRKAERTLELLRRQLPDWRFFEDQVYELPETFGMREVS